MAHVAREKVHFVEKISNYASFLRRLFNIFNNRAGNLFQQTTMEDPKYRENAQIGQFAAIAIYYICLEMTEGFSDGKN